MRDIQIVSMRDIQTRKNMDFQRRFSWALENVYTKLHFRVKNVPKCNSCLPPLFRASAVVWVHLRNRGRVMHTTCKKLNERKILILPVGCKNNNNISFLAKSATGRDLKNIFLFFPPGEILSKLKIPSLYLISVCFCSLSSVHDAN